MKNPCKLCLVQAACTTKCKDRQTYKKWKIDRRQKFQDIFLDIVGTSVIIILMSFTLILMMK